MPIIESGQSACVIQAVLVDGRVETGRLVNNQIEWRGDSGLQDGKEEDLDLSKGLYDAGDLIKFGFPMAFNRKEVGDPSQHKCWERPKTSTEKRPAIQVNMSHPGSDVAAETATAMAGASLVFKNNNARYSKSLLEHSWIGTRDYSAQLVVPEALEFVNRFEGGLDGIKG
ncbi:hypothetical protein LXL04_007972 [Taraxacum kok-saghyz]